MIPILHRTALVLCVLMLVVFAPSLAFGQDAPLPDTSEPLAVWAMISGKLGAPIAFGYALTYAVDLLRKVPGISTLLFERWFTSDFSRRAFVTFLAVAPGVALILTEHMAWDRALLTALLTYGVSQWKFLSAKLAEKSGDAPTVPPLPMLLAMAFLVVGCGVSKDKIEKGINGAATALDVAKPCLVATQDKLEADCNGDAACIDGVRDHFAPIADAYDAFGELLCAIDSTAEGCAR